MRLDGGMIHTKACMQWCAYYTWEILHTPIYQGIGMGHGRWLTLFLDKLKGKVDHFCDYVDVRWNYEKELHRITFDFTPTRAAETFSVYVHLDKPLREAIWMVRRAPHDPDLETGEIVCDIDELFHGFDYDHLNKDPINLE